MEPSVQSVVRRPHTVFLMCVVTVLILLTNVSTPVRADGAAFLVEDIQPGPGPVPHRRLASLQRWGIISTFPHTPKIPALSYGVAMELRPEHFW
jgi:hypothetical protein